MKPTTPRRRPVSPVSRQEGLTLVELMVAMALGLLIVLAATASLVVARRGFTTVDAASQLRDNARFANDLIGRIVVQAGFEDITYAVSNRKLEDGTLTNPPPGIFGFNNALISATDPANTAGTAGLNGSDVLVVRYQAGETYPGSGQTDGTMIDCQGNTVPAVALNRDDRMVSIFNVALNNGEPSLMCTTVSGGNVVSEPVVQGVEDFQVLYGVDGVVANTAPAATLSAPARTDRYLRADQLTVGGAGGVMDPVATNANWRRVRSVRVGMVLRAASNTVQQQVGSSQYPFGPAGTSSTGADDGSALSSNADVGTKLDIDPTDSRLRQVVTFTINVRNPQDLGYALP